MKTPNLINLLDEGYKRTKQTYEGLPIYYNKEKNSYVVYNIKTDEVSEKLE